MTEGEGRLNLNTGKAELIYGILQMGHPGAEKPTLATCATDMPWFSEEV